MLRQAEEASPDSKHSGWSETGGSRKHYQIVFKRCRSPETKFVAHQGMLIYACIAGHVVMFNTCI